MNEDKVLKYQGRLQYFRTKCLAIYELNKLKNELKLNLRIEKC